VTGIWGHFTALVYFSPSLECADPAAATALPQNTFSLGID
jgi:hypothetical protein